MFFRSMKQESPPLISFITDYDLEQPNGVICFTAEVRFQSKRNIFKFISPVHVITISIKHMDVIYLLNPDIDGEKIKTMYTNNQRFRYSPDKKQFEIRGKSRRYGYYSLVIIPITKHCEHETISELKATKYN